LRPMHVMTMRTINDLVCFLESRSCPANGHMDNADLLREVNVVCAVTA
jgi:hypothetical protein